MIIQPASISSEQKFVTALAGDFPRHPFQLNGLFQADAEIISLEHLKGKFLVLKTDGIHEEIRQKLYDDPWLIGWMTITAPVSDLAAAGAEPMGLLLSVVLPVDFNDDWLSAYKQGIRDALNVYKTYILGGDTNFDDLFSSSATAIAIQDITPLTRKGVNAGDNIYASGLMGIGNAYAYTKLFDRHRQLAYQPCARLNEMKIIREFAGACVDTSDGFFPALNLLSSINNLGFDISEPLENLLPAHVNKLAIDAEIPAWMMLAGPHGEYELIFSIPDEKLMAFLSTCKKAIWEPLYIGRAKKEPTFHFVSESLPVKCAPAFIADLFHQVNNNSRAYFELLKTQHKTWQSTLNLIK